MDWGACQLGIELPSVQTQSGAGLVLLRGILHATGGVVQVRAVEAAPLPIRLGQGKLHTHMMSELSVRPGALYQSK